MDTSDVNESHNKESHRIAEQEEENYQVKCEEHVRNMQHGATFEVNGVNVIIFIIMCKLVIIVLLLQSLGALL